jgi:hypothetical protein
MIEEILLDYEAMKITFKRCIRFTMQVVRECWKAGAPSLHFLTFRYLQFRTLSLDGGRQ